MVAKSVFDFHAPSLLIVAGLFLCYNQKWVNVFVCGDMIMKNVKLLDCTLRDGGYLNDWNFGQKAIRGTAEKIAQTGVEFFEIGFIKDEKPNPDRTVFPSVQSIAPFIAPKSPALVYLGMIDCKCPPSLDSIPDYDGSSVDGIRVIFKKDKIDFAYDYCRGIKEKGYMLFVQFVGTDSYSDIEFVETVQRFNSIQPYAMSIVDTFGTIKRKQFLRLVYLADNNMDKNITLGYHAHNNLQQAFGNAVTMVEMNLNREICIDACVFGMGRGAGNLNLELFADHMNENYGTSYHIEPMLEIMDDYLNEIYSRRFWGYCLPYYLSATNGCHPNYAIYLEEKHSLTEKNFNEILRSIPAENRRNYRREDAEKFYKQYMDQYVDDRKTVADLKKIFAGKPVLLLAPGMSIVRECERIRSFISEKNPVVVAVNCIPPGYTYDFVFSSNMRRYGDIQDFPGNAKRIVTSNMKNLGGWDYMLNFSSYALSEPDLIDNSGLMFLNFLRTVSPGQIYVAGMDGYSTEGNYFKQSADYDSATFKCRNTQIQEKLLEFSRELKISMITESVYRV